MRTEEEFRWGVGDASSTRTVRRQRSNETRGDSFPPSSLNDAIRDRDREQMGRTTTRCARESRTSLRVSGSPGVST